ASGPHQGSYPFVPPPAGVTGIACGIAAPGVAEPPPVESFSKLVSIGRALMRLPVAAKMALLSAGAMTGMAGSPAPVGDWPLGTTWICISGMILARASL